MQMKGFGAVVDAGIVDGLVYAGFLALGAAGVALVLRALFHDRRDRAGGRRPARFFVPPSQEGPAAMTTQPSADAIENPLDTGILDETTPPLATGTGAAITDYPLLATPHVMLAGSVDHAMYASFRDQIAAAPADGPIVIALSTLGGDPEVARLMGDEVRLIREAQGREFLFLGKVAVYSAGATFMAAFPVDKRFLTRGTRIMIHERVMTKTVQIAGPLKTCIANLKANLHEIEHSMLIEEEGFRDIVAGSRVSFEEVVRRAPENWYIEAAEARELGLVLDIV